MVKIYAIRNDDSINHQLLRYLIRLVSVQKQRKILSYVNLKDAQSSLIAELLLRYVLMKEYGLVNSNIMIKSEENRKPKLLSPYEHIKFNCSHSGDWIVCVVSSYEVGIDVEEIVDRNISFTKRFFSGIEYQQLVNTDDDHKLDFFYKLWTAKESYVKWDGRGLSLPLNEFSIYFDTPSNIKLITSHDAKCYFKQYNLDGNYILSVCSTSNLFSENVEVFRLDEVVLKMKNVI